MVFKVTQHLQKKPYCEKVQCMLAITFKDSIESHFAWTEDKGNAAYPAPRKIEFGQIAVQMLKI
jgi:hypothetical protein